MLVTNGGMGHVKKAMALEALSAAISTRLAGAPEHAQGEGQGQGLGLEKAIGMSHAQTALVLFSAGQDSATCLAWALERFSRVETIGFDYGQRHAIELTQRPLVLAGVAALSPRWAARLGPDVCIDLRGYGQLIASALTRDVAIAASESSESALPNTFVPGRNLVFLSIAAGHAFARGHSVLVGGMCETDYSGYPDCRRVTLDAMQQALALGISAGMSIETPLMHLTKAQTWALAERHGGRALVELIRTQTHTCYEGVRDALHPWGFGCGTCPACRLRAAGWATYANGMTEALAPDRGE